MAHTETMAETLLPVQRAVAAALQATEQTEAFSMGLNGGEDRVEAVLTGKALERHGVAAEAEEEIPKGETVRPEGETEPNIPRAAPLEQPTPAVVAAVEMTTAAVSPPEMVKRAAQAL